MFFTAVNFTVVANAKIFFAISKDFVRYLSVMEYYAARVKPLVNVSLMANASLY